MGEKNKNAKQLSIINIAYFIIHERIILSLVISYKNRKKEKNNFLYGHSHQIQYSTKHLFMAGSGKDFYFFITHIRLFCYC